MIEKKIDPITNKITFMFKIILITFWVLISTSNAITYSGKEKNNKIIYDYKKNISNQMYESIQINNSLTSFEKEFLYAILDNNYNALKNYSSTYSISPNLRVENGMNPFLIACKYNSNVEVFDILLKQGFQISSKDNDGNDCLYFVIRYNNNMNLIKFLIENGVDINSVNNASENNLLVAAKYVQDINIFQFIINSGIGINYKNKQGYNAIVYSFENEHISPQSLISILIKSGISINSKTVSGNNILMEALKYNIDISFINFLLKSGIDINDKNYKGETAFMIAAQNTQNPEIIKYLLSIKNININDEDENNNTALHLAITSNQSDEIIQEILTSKKILLNSRNNNLDTPLSLAAEHSTNVNVFRFLLNSGGNINIKNKKGFSPLMIAIINNKNSEIIKILINDKNILLSRKVSNGNDTILMLASKYIDNLSLFKHIYELTKSSYNYTNQDGMNALMIAAQYNKNPLILDFMINENKGGKKFFGKKSNNQKKALDYALSNPYLNNSSAFTKLEQLTN
jgi:hypothetical protein